MKFEIENIDIYLMVNGVTRLPNIRALSHLQKASTLPGLQGNHHFELLNRFFERYPRKLARFMATFPLYAKYYKTAQIVLSEAILYKLTNNDQTPKANALCAFNFANQHRLVADYARGGTSQFEDVSMMDIHPDLAENFISRVPANSQVISIGFGEGKLEARLIANGCSVTGIEFVSRFAQKGRALGIEVIEGGAHSALEALDRKYGAVVMSEVLGDLDPHQIFEQAERILAKGGKILLSTYLPTLEVDGTGYERHWSRSLEEIFLPLGLVIKGRKVWLVKDDSLEKIEEVKSGLDVEDGYVFYEIMRSRDI